MSNFTAKEARRNSSESGQVIKNIKQMDQLIRRYCNLGFTNLIVDIEPKIEDALYNNLKKRGFRVFVKPNTDSIVMEIEW